MKNFLNDETVKKLYDSILFERFLFMNGFI